jgi:hypothetical protein
MKKTFRPGRKHRAFVAGGVSAWARANAQLWRLHTLDVFGFQPFFAGNNLEGHDVAFIEGFEARTDNGRVMHKDVLAGILGDETEALFIVEPLDFATGHIRS